MGLVFFLVSVFSLSSFSYDLTVLHTNDHHGHFNKLKDGSGGMAARKTYIDSVRAKVKAEGGHVLLLSGGDINTGTFESDILDAKPDFMGMNIIGYDAMAVGNHEWDNELAVLKSQEKMANFPFLSANTRYKENKQRVFAPYVIKCLDEDKDLATCSKKVGIFGLTTPETPGKASSDDSREKVDFTDPVKEARSVVEELKKENVDLIIAVTHMGHDGVEKNEHGETVFRDVLIAKQVKGIDVIVGGHSQVALTEPIEVGKTLVVQAKEYGKFVGKLELEISKTAVRKKAYQLFAINPHDTIVIDGEEKCVLKKDYKLLAEDEVLKSLFSQFNLNAQKSGGELIGSLSDNFNGERINVRSQETPIGTFVAKVMANAVGADIAMMNGGGIRTGLLKGDVSRKMIHDMYPFGDSLVTAKLAPQELVEYMKAAHGVTKTAKSELLRSTPDLSGAFPHFYGVQAIVRRGKIIELRSVDAKTPWRILIENNNVKSSTKDYYTLTVTEFVGKGTEGYPDIRKRKDYSVAKASLYSALVKFFGQAKGRKVDPKVFEELTAKFPLFVPI